MPKQTIIDRPSVFAGDSVFLPAPEHVPAAGTVALAAHAPGRQQPVTGVGPFTGADGRARYVITLPDAATWVARFAATTTITINSRSTEQTFTLGAPFRIIAHPLSGPPDPDSMMLSAFTKALAAMDAAANGGTVDHQAMILPDGRRVDRMPRAELAKTIHQLEIRIANRRCGPQFQRRYL